MNSTIIIVRLWATEISDHFPEDAKTKKLTLHSGLLEKGTNKSFKSFASDGLREVFYYQQEMGGIGNKITGYELEPDKELDRTYCCLTVTARVASRNTYIKPIIICNRTIQI